jgi:hypothetical protein
MAMNCNVTNDKVSGNIVLQDEVLAGLLATFVLPYELALMMPYLQRSLLE